MDEVVPNRLLSSYGSFAEIRTFGQGDKPVFIPRTGRTPCAKQFITRVDLLLHETFKLGAESLRLKTAPLAELLALDSRSSLMVE